MPWPIRYHEKQPRQPRPGDMWPEPDFLKYPAAAATLSEQYHQQYHGRRLPLMVCLPNGTFWCIDSRPARNLPGWDVSGDPPNITVSPSIDNAHGELYGYHGFLTNGVLSDDVEGRTFEGGCLMPCQCRMIDPTTIPDKERQPGDMWFEPWYLQRDNPEYYLSERYRQDWMGKRAPIVVRLPCGRDFCVDGRTKGDSSGWTVTGEAPNITVSPSINHVGAYHGSLTNGILSDDVDGRTFLSKGD